MLTKILSSLVLTLQNNGQEIPINVNFQTISSSTGEASHTEYRINNRDEILAAHQVPVYRLGIAETGSLGQTNIVEQNKIYNRKVIKPIQKIFEDLFNKIISDQFGEYVAKKYKFEFNPIDLEDDLQQLEMKLKKFQFYLTELQSGAIDMEYYYELTEKDFSKFERDLKTEMLQNEVVEEIINKSKKILE